MSADCVFTGGKSFVLRSSSILLLTSCSCCFDFSNKGSTNAGLTAVFLASSPDLIILRNSSDFLNNSFV